MGQNDVSYSEYDPADLLGRSVHDEKVIAYLEFHRAAEPTGIVGIESYGGLGESGFELSAEQLQYYRRRVGEPRSTVTGAAEEMIVERITFSDAGLNTKESKRYPYPLPFALQFGDSADDITKKLSKKPFRKSTSVGVAQHIWEYVIGDTWAIIKLTAERHLCAIYLLECDIEMRRAKERKATLRAESANIDPAHVEKVEALRSAIPTPRWRATMADGDIQFTAAMIAAAEEALNRFIDEVKSATAKKSAAAIYSAVKKVVTTLNKLNQSGTNPIETLERDELGELIDNVVSATGFKLKEDEDITAPWREW